MDLATFMEERRAPILESSTDALVRAKMPHYDAAGLERVRERLATLFDRVREAVRDRDTTVLVEHARCIARERFEAGFDLTEVQTALNVLEEAIWRRVLDETPPEDYAAALGCVSTALGVAKDALGSEYVSLASKTHTQTLDLSALFQGT